MEKGKKATFKPPVSRQLSAGPPAASLRHFSITPPPPGLMSSKTNQLFQGLAQNFQQVSLSSNEVLNGTKKFSLKCERYLRSW